MLSRALRGHQSMDYIGNWVFGWELKVSAHTKTVFPLLSLAFALAPLASSTGTICCWRRQQTSRVSYQNYASEAGSGTD